MCDFALFHTVPGLSSNTSRESVQAGTASCKNMPFTVDLKFIETVSNVIPCDFPPESVQVTIVFVSLNHADYVMRVLVEIFLHLARKTFV